MLRMNIFGHGEKNYILFLGEKFYDSKSLYNCLIENFDYVKHSGVIASEAIILFVETKFPVQKIQVHRFLYLKNKLIKEEHGVPKILIFMSHGPILSIRDLNFDLMKWCQPKSNLEKFLHQTYLDYYERGNYSDVPKSGIYNNIYIEGFFGLEEFDPEKISYRKNILRRSGNNIIIRHIFGVVEKTFFSENFIYDRNSPVSVYCFKLEYASTWVKNYGKPKFYVGTVKKLNSTNYNYILFHGKNKITIAYLNYDALRSEMKSAPEKILKNGYVDPKLTLEYYSLN